MITATVTAGELLAGACFQTEQQRLNAFTQATVVSFPINASIVNYGSTTPSAAQNEFPWFKLAGDGTPAVGPWYVYQNGLWLARHTIPASSPLSLFYKGSLASITTYDGGESGTVGDASGPMWEVDPDMEGLTAVGVSTDFPYNTTGGLKEVTLSADEQGPITATALGTTPTGPGSVFISALNGGSSGNRTQPATSAHENMPPYRSAYFIRRTARIFFVG